MPSGLSGYLLNRDSVLSLPSSFTYHRLTEIPIVDAH